MISEQSELTRPVLKIECNLLHGIYGRECKDCPIHLQGIDLPKISQRVELKTWGGSILDDSRELHSLCVIPEYCKREVIIDLFLIKEE